MKSQKALLKVLQGGVSDHVPIWLMRQAGRYLPEYRALRTEAKNFLDLCLTPAWATEITLQPIRRFGFDAAILFADILLIPYALGQKLEFKEGIGPVLEQLEDEKSLASLKLNSAKLNPVMETLNIVNGKLDDKTTLIGFCGSPWTVAAYMIDGTSKNGFAKALGWVANKPELLERLIAVLIDASEQYLKNQIAAGAEVIQLFESWAGLLNGNAFKRWVIEPTRELVARIKRAHPEIPIIGFPREAGENYIPYAGNTGVNAISIDQNMSLQFAREKLHGKILQGNLDPQILVKGGQDMLDAAAMILNTFGAKHIFNLGHGVVPETPVNNVAALVKFVQNYKAAR